MEARDELERLKAIIVAKNREIEQLKQVFHNNQIVLLIGNSFHQYRVSELHPKSLIDEKIDW